MGLPSGGGLDAARLVSAASGDHVKLLHALAFPPSELQRLASCLLWLQPPLLFVVLVRFLVDLSRDDREFAIHGGAKESQETGIILELPEDSLGALERGVRLNAPDPLKGSRER